MIHLEDLQPNASIRGILPNELVTVVSVQLFGSEALELTYKSSTGKVANELIYREDEPRLELGELDWWIMEDYDALTNDYFNAFHSGCCKVAVDFF